MMSKEGDGLGVAHRLTQEGHDVSVWIKEPRFELAGRGIVNRVASWRSVFGRSDLVICDMVGFGPLENTLRLKPCLSCSEFMDQAELDRGLGMRLFRAAGINIPLTIMCKNKAEAKAAVKSEEWGDGWVLKPSGNKSTSKTICVTDQETWEWSLDFIPEGELIVQRIVKGVEVSTEGWFNGRDWVRPFNHTFEEKKFLNDGLGPTVGCAGNVVFSAPSNRLTKSTVERLKAGLVQIGYRGPVDVNCIVDKDNAYGLEITARLGYDAIEALLEGLREPAIDLFFEVASGTKKSMKVTSEPMIAVRMSVPPYPMAKPKEENRGEPVLGLSNGALAHVAITDLYKEGDSYLTAGGDGVLLKATATGDFSASANADERIVREARRRVYRTLDGLKVTGKQYRTDIGLRADRDWRQLKQWGWV